MKQILLRNMLKTRAPSAARERSWLSGSIRLSVGIRQLADKSVDEM